MQLSNAAVTKTNYQQKLNFKCISYLNSWLFIYKIMGVSDAMGKDIFGGETFFLTGNFKMYLNASG